MKTQNYTQTKVNSRVTIVILYISTVALSVALIGLTANAQQLWNQFSNASSYGKLASVMVGYPSETANTDAAFEAIDAEILTQLSNSSGSFLYEPKLEEEMLVEEWMIEESIFNSHGDFNSIEAEESLKIEDWMMNSSNFSSQEAESVEMEKHWKLNHG